MLSFTMIRNISFFMCKNDHYQIIMIIYRIERISWLMMIFSLTQHDRCTHAETNGERGQEGGVGFGVWFWDSYGNFVRHDAMTSIGAPMQRAECRRQTASRGVTLPCRCAVRGALRGVCLHSGSVMALTIALVSYWTLASSSGRRNNANVLKETLWAS